MSLVDFDNLTFNDNIMMKQNRIISDIEDILKLCDLLVEVLEKDLRFHTTAIHIVLSSKSNANIENRPLISELLDDFDLKKMEGLTADIYLFSNFLTSSNSRSQYIFQLLLLTNTIRDARGQTIKFFKGATNVKTRGRKFYFIRENV